MVKQIITPIYNMYAEIGFLVFGLVSWGLTAFYYRQAKFMINEAGKALNEKVNSLEINVLEHHNNMDVAKATMQNKVYETSVMLLKVKHNFEQLLEYSDNMIDQERYDEIKTIIRLIDDELKEISFVSNLGKKTSVIKDVHFLKDSDFSKN